MNDRPSRITTLLLSLGLCCAVLRWTSPAGLALTTDSLRYLYASVTWGHQHQLLIPSYKLGDSTWTPLTHFPPLYPILLSAVNGRNGFQQAQHAASTIAIVASALTLFLVSESAHHIVRDGFTRTALLIAVVSTLVVSGVLLFVESEAAWLPLLVATLISLAKFMESEDFRWLLIGCVLVAAGTLARYAAIAAIPLLAYSTWGLPRRRNIGLLATAVSALPLAACMLRNARLTHSAIDRSFALSAPPASTVAIGFLLVAFAAWRHQQSKRSLARISYAFVFCYAATVVIAISTVEPRTVFDGRLLSPAIIALLVAAPSEGAHLGPASVRRRVMALTAPVLIAAGVMVVRANSRGLGFTSKAWRSSELMKGLRDVPSSAPLASNGPDVIYLYLGRRSHWTPNTPTSGYVAAFDALSWRPYVAGPMALASAPHLRLIRKYSDGALYSVVP